MDMSGKTLWLLAVCAVSLGVWANQAPRAHSAVLYAEPGKPITLTLSAEDPDGDPLVYELLDAPRSGKLVGSPPALSYLAPPTLHGVDRFSFRVADPYGAFDIGVVEVRVDPGYAALRVVPDVPKGLDLAGLVEFLVQQGVRTWYVVDMEPRAFLPSVLPFLFVGPAQDARAFIVGPLEASAIRILPTVAGYAWVDLRQAPAGTYFFLVVSGSEAFSYPFRIVQPALDCKLAFGG